QCFCSFTLQDSPDSNQCNYPCASTTTGEICGGFDAISVYEFGVFLIPTSVTVPPVGSYESIGCRVDDRDDR
ncbi:unnamed protein product, partial [Hapterophycus canaliculatus]